MWVRDCMITLGSAIPIFWHSRHAREPSAEKILVKMLVGGPNMGESS
jgi:hypothetical protein